MFKVRFFARLRRAQNDKGAGKTRRAQNDNGFTMQMTRFVEWAVRFTKQAVRFTVQATNADDTFREADNAFNNEDDALEGSQSNERWLDTYGGGCCAGMAVAGNGTDRIAGGGDRA